MIPVKLTIQGIYSYQQQKQTIDFTKLTEAHIFGIFGSVGSGKSTILEAITFAIYGRTDRMNLSGDNRNYNMMNLKSDELYIEFEFRAGQDLQQYMIKAKGRRNSKQFEEVKAIDRTAYRYTGADYLPVEFKEIEAAIGLSYENFKRTIIIPQGRFQEFLQLGKSDRTQMMKELFDLGKYELYYKVVALESKNNEQLSALAGQLLQIGFPDSESIKAIEKELITLKDELDKKSLELSQKQTEDNLLLKLKELVDKKNSVSGEFEKEMKQEEDFIFLERKINEYDYCIIHFKSLLESLNDINSRIGKLSLEIESDNLQLVKCEKVIEGLKAKLAILKKEFDKRDILKKQSEELLFITRIKRHQEEAGILQDRINKGEIHLKETKANVSGLKNQSEELADTLKILRQQIPDLSALSQIRNWFTEYKFIKSSFKETETEYLQQEVQLNELKLARDKLIKGIPGEAAISGSELKLAEKTDLKKQQLADINAELEHLNVQLKLDEYASELKDGKPCPLCGSLSHPALSETKNISEKVEEFRRKRKNVEQEIIQIDELIRNIKDHENTLKLKQELVDKTKQKLVNQEENLKKHNEKFVWPRYKDEEVVEAEFKQAAELKKNLEEKEVNFEQISFKVKEEQDKVDKYSEAIENLKHQYTIKITEWNTYKAQLKSLKIEDFEKYTNAEIDNQRNAIIKQIEKSEKDFKECEELVNIKQKEINSLEGRLQANRKIFNEEQKKKTEVYRKFDEELSKSQYSSSDEIDKVLNDIDNIEFEKKRAGEYRQKLEMLKQQLIILESEIGNRNYNEEEHKKLGAFISKLKEELILKNQDYGRRENELKKLKKDMEEFKILVEKQTKLQERAEDIKTLKRMFKASGFVNYVSSVKLQEICHSANKRFYELTRQKLSLEVTDDNTFQVRDFLNGGKVRNVKTLSGGQTFQAALSLALSLVDNIQKFTESDQNFFFLDEGFGSLDRESLSIVFDTLKSLRRENRIVGVISHVEEMQQEIDVHLRVINDEEKGSIVKASWE